MPRYTETHPTQTETKAVIYYILPLILCAAGLAVQAQTGKPAAPRPAAHKGSAATGTKQGQSLLLGLYFPSGGEGDPFDTEQWDPSTQGPHGKYVTYLISPSADGISVQVVPDILVASDRGLMRMGSEFRDAEDYSEELLWAAAPGKTPNVAGLGEDTGNRVGHGVKVITYAGPQYVSFLEHWSVGNAERIFNQTRVVSYNDLHASLPVLQVLGAGGEASYLQLAKSIGRTPKPASRSCPCCAADSKNWGIRHEHGAWQLYGKFQRESNGSCEPGEDDHVIKFSVPRKLISGNGAADWDSLVGPVASQIKIQPAEVRDLLVSPGKDLLVVTTNQTLAILPMASGQPKGPAKTLALEPTSVIFMETWAGGKVASGWSRAMQAETPRAMK